MNEPYKSFSAPSPIVGSISARAAANASPHRYLQGLNPEQLEAVEALDGPVLVLAGAGTGKTRVLTTRIAHIIATKRARNQEILSVTFTNKASREMKHRIALYIGEMAEGMQWLGTFHSISTKLLRRHAELVGLKSDFTILDTDDQIRLMKQVIRAENIDEKRWPARQLAFLIDGWKNRGLSPDKVPAAEATGYAGGRGGALYRLYQNRLKTLNACDFGDLLMECIRLFQEHPDVLKSYQDRFKYILVDEYQDTNVAQYLWLRLLAQGRRNVCCVGDDDQSIYGWRGADVDNILRFEHDFPGAKVVKLERNYRSTGHILASAAHIIKNNEGRLGKTLFTDGNMGEQVSVSGCWDSEEEARLVADEIEVLQHKKHQLNEIAILVRASFQMREFEERFVTTGIPYRVIGGPRFYERLEIRDALAYFRCVCQPADDLAFERIVNTPKRGLGDATLSVIHTYARANGIPMIQAVRFIVETEELKPKPRTTLKDLIGCFDRWAAQLGKISHTELCETILEESGYIAMWKADRSADAAGRLENLKELIRSMQDFENLQGFLEHISLVMETASGETEDRVTIMTLHGAKGLEFETVFLPGWEEGLFPHPRALDEQGRAGLEEERRLAYVGLTRAKRKANLFFASNRRIHGMWNATIPSRFIDELPEANVLVNEGAGSNFGGYNQRGGNSRFDTVQPFGNSSYNTPGWQRGQQNSSQVNSSPKPAKHSVMIEGEVLANSSTGTSRFDMGARIFHTKFGYGLVAVIDGNKLTVDFEKAGRKMVLESFLQNA